MFNKVKQFIKSGKTKAVALVGSALSLMSVGGLCETTANTYFEITADTVAPVTTAITSGLTTLIPIGIGIMATFIGIALIKRVIYTFL